MSKSMEDHSSIDVYEALQKVDLNNKQRPTDEQFEYGQEEHSFGNPPFP